MGRHISLLPDPSSVEKIVTCNWNTTPDSSVVGRLHRALACSVSANGTSIGHSTMFHPDEDDLAVATVGLARLCQAQVLHQTGVHSGAVEERHRFRDDHSVDQNHQ
jgi:hypothetical protein